MQLRTYYNIQTKKRITTNYYYYITPRVRSIYYNVGTYQSYTVIAYIAISSYVVICHVVVCCAYEHTMPHYNRL